MTNKFYIRSTAKTFRKGTDWLQVFGWFNENVSVVFPETKKPSAMTDRKYVITIKEVR